MTRLTYICDMSHSHSLCSCTTRSHYYVCVAWLVHTCEMTHLCVEVRVHLTYIHTFCSCTRFVHVHILTNCSRATPSYISRSYFYVHVPWLLNICNMTHFMWILEYIWRICIRFVQLFCILVLSAFGLRRGGLYTPQSVAVNDHVFFVPLLSSTGIMSYIYIYESWHIWMSHDTYEWVTSRMNKSCHIWMSHVTCEWAMSHVNESCKHMKESCHIWMSHVTYEWAMSHMNESCHIWMSHVTYEWAMSHMNESCHIWMSHVTYEWVMSHIGESCHIWMSHDAYEWVMTHMNESCHIWRSHVTYGWMSHVTHEWVMSHMNESCHIWMSHVRNKRFMTHMNESCHIWMSHVTYEWVMSHMNESRHTWKIHDICVMTLSCVTRFLPYVSWLFLMWHDSLMRTSHRPWLNYTLLHLECLFLIFKLNRLSSSLRLVCHVLLKRDQLDWV